MKEFCKWRFVLFLVNTVILSATMAVSIEGIYLATDFGAVGNGKTDNTIAIQNAIDKAAITGGRVYVPPGKYLVKASLKIRPGVALVGSNEAPFISTSFDGYNYTRHKRTRK